MGVAVGRRIDDNLQSFAVRWIGAALAPVERAGIGGGLLRHLAARQLIELGRIISGEKHIMVGKVETAGARVRQPHHCGERARFHRCDARSGANVGTEQTSAQRGRVAVEQHR